MRRTGLAGDGIPDAAMEHLLPVVERDLADEAHRLRDMNLGGISLIAPAAGAEANARAIAGFLDVPFAIAHDRAKTPHLFTD